MSCCCAPDADDSVPKSRRKLEFSKVCSSGFEKERKTVYYSDDDEKSPCDKVRSDSSVLSGYNNDLPDSDDDIGDMVFVDGNEDDLDECDDEDTLMERVWWLSKPPYVPRQTPIVPARRIQVVKERISSSVKGLPSTRAALMERARKSLQGRRNSKSKEYIIMGKFSMTSQVACGKNEQTSIPVCARKLSDVLL